MNIILLFYEFKHPQTDWIFQKWGASFWSNTDKLIMSTIYFHNLSKVFQYAYD